MFTLSNAIFDNENSSAVDWKLSVQIMCPRVISTWNLIIKCLLKEEILVITDRMRNYGFVALQNFVYFGFFYKRMQTNSILLARLQLPELELI